MGRGPILALSEFRRQWELLADSTPGESVKKYSLSIKTLQEAVNAVVDFVGLRPVDNSQTVPEGMYILYS